MYKKEDYTSYLNYMLLIVLAYNLIRYNLLLYIHLFFAQ